MGKDPELQKLAKELAFLRTVRRQSLLRLPTFEASECQSVKQATEDVKREIPSRTRLSVYLSTNDKTDISRPCSRGGAAICGMSSIPRPRRNGCPPSPSARYTPSLGNRIIWSKESLRRPASFSEWS